MTAEQVENIWRQNRQSHESVNSEVRRGSFVKVESVLCIKIVIPFRIRKLSFLFKRLRWVSTEILLQPTDSHSTTMAGRIQAAKLNEVSMEQLAFTVAEACAAARVGRTALYQAIRSG